MKDFFRRKKMVSANVCNFILLTSGAFFFASQISAAKLSKLRSAPEQAFAEFIVSQKPKKIILTQNNSDPSPVERVVRRAKISDLKKSEEIQIRVFAERMPTNTRALISSDSTTTETHPILTKNDMAQSSPSIQISVTKPGSKQLVTLGPTLQVADELIELDQKNMLTSHASAAHSGRMNNFQSDKEDSFSNTETEQYENSQAEGPDVVHGEDLLTDVESLQEELEYQSVKLQLFDDRSDFNARRAFPLPRVQAKLVGTDKEFLSDSIGQIWIQDLPKNARFLVKLQDPLGRVRPTTVEIDTVSDSGSQAVKKIVMVRHQAVEVFESTIGVPLSSWEASLCGTVRDHARSQHPVPLAQLSIEGQNVRAFYFNDLGFLDPRLNATTINGRFCIFGVLPGVASVHLFKNGEHQGTTPIGVWGGETLTTDFYAEDLFSARTYLAAVPTPVEQLSGDSKLANSLKLVDMVDVIPVGSGESMASVDHAKVEATDGLMFHEDRSFAVVQASEFESAFYELNAVKNGEEDDESRSEIREKTAVTTLLPRGFVEDLARFANVDYEPTRGSLVVEHEAFSNQTEAVRIRLIDDRGQTVSAPWYFGDYPRTKAAFFNLESKQYQLIIENSDGDLLGGATVFIFDETVSVIRTGSHLQVTRN